MIVAGLQIDIAWEDPPENLRRAEELTARAVGTGARLVALPEMFATGFSMAAERVAPHADFIRDGLGQIALKHGVWVIGGYAEPAESPAESSNDASARPRNACSLFDPAGTERLHYHKIHPFTLAGEDKHFAGGDALPTAEVEGIRVTPLICYDLRFPEPFRAVADRTDLYVVIANWPVARREAWRTLLRARAIENQAFALGVNRVGEGDGLVYGGDSALIGPLGETIAWNAEQAGLLLGDVSAEAVAAVRERFGFLADRRPDVYEGLT